MCAYDEPKIQSPRARVCFVHHLAADQTQGARLKLSRANLGRRETLHRGFSKGQSVICFCEAPRPYNHLSEGSLLGLDFGYLRPSL